MHVEELQNEGLKRAYKVVVGVDEIEERLQVILKDLRDRVHLKGFRPGKAPLPLLKRLHGERAFGQVIEETVSESTEKVFRDNQVRPAMRPDVDLEDVEQDKDLAFTVKVEVLPEIDIADFAAPALERLVAKAGDQDIDSYLERLAAQQKRFEPAAKTYKAKDGDAVVIDFIGRIDGEAFDGGAGEDHQLELGSGTFIPGFEEQLVGVKTGDKKDVTVTFPEDYGANELAGKEAVFEVTAKEVRKPADVKIDDDLAKNLGLDDLAALREMVSQQIGRENAELSRARLKRALLDALADRYDFAVPQGMVDLEYRQIWEQIKRDAIMAGEAKPEDYEGKDEPDDEADRTEVRSIAERRVRLGLLLSELGMENNIQIGKDELNRRVVEEARRYPGQEQQVFEFYQNNEQAMAQLRAPLYEDKVVDFILEMADITDRDVTREELERALAEVDDDAQAEAKPKPAAKKAAAKKPATKKPAAAKSAGTTARKKAAEKTSDE